MLEDILDNDEEEDHVFLSLVIWVLIPIRVELFLGVLKQSLQKEAHSEKVSLWQIQVLDGLIDEGTYKYNRVNSLTYRAS